LPIHPVFRPEKQGNFPSRALCSRQSVAKERAMPDPSLLPLYFAALAARLAVG